MIRFKEFLQEGWKTNAAMAAATVLPGGFVALGTAYLAKKLYDKYKEKKKKDAKLQGVPSPAAAVPA